MTKPTTLPSHIVTIFDAIWPNDDLPTSNKVYVDQFPEYGNEDSDETEQYRESQDYCEPHTENNF